MTERLIQLWGLPRSGSTVICKFFNSIPEAAFLSEPVFELERTGNVHGRNTVESALDSLGASIRGFKEVIHEGFGMFDKWTSKPGWEVICIVRDPVDIWGSLRQTKWGVRAHPTIGTWIPLCREYHERIRNRTILSYESFVRNPSAAVRRVTGLKVPDIVTLKPLQFKFGCMVAKNATRVHVACREPEPPRADIDAIEAAGLDKVYLELSQR